MREIIPINLMNLMPELSDVTEARPAGQTGDIPFGDFLLGDREPEEPEDLCPEAEEMLMPAVTVIVPVTTQAPETEPVTEDPAPRESESLLTAVQNAVTDRRTGISVSELMQMDSELRVVDFLEGNDVNQDIAPPEPQESDIVIPAPPETMEMTDRAGEREAMARMPLVTGEEPVIPPSELGEARTGTGTEAEPDGGDPYPLENINDNQTPALGEEQEERAGAARTEGEFSQLMTGPADISPERTAAVETLKSMATEPVSRENLFDTLVETMTLMESGQQQSIQLQLRPAFLGRVSVELVMTDGSLRARIAAESESVRQLLGAELGALAESLEAKGIALTAIEVVETGISDMNFGRPSSSDGEAPQGQGGRHGAPPVQVTEPAEPSDIWADMEQYMDEDELSSVEYRV